MSRYVVTVASLAVLIIANLGGGSAEAGFRQSRCGDTNLDKGYVVARSRHGNGSVRGSVRPSRYGYQVRTPGGNWMNCRRSCTETLRVETVDFWEGRQELQVGLAQECGVFGWIDFGIGF